MGGTIKEHFDWSMNNDEAKRDIIGEIKDDLYVDDLITGGNTELEVRLIKETVINVLKSGCFELHKWHSNLSSLECDDDFRDNGDFEVTYAKDELGVNYNESKILGIAWEKISDTLVIDLSQCKQTQEYTKRGVLKAMACVYDPLGIVSPLLLIAKNIYREICDGRNLPNEMDYLD